MKVTVEDTNMMDGMGQGLAGKMAGQPTGRTEITVEAVADMLLQGASPEELVEQGIPVELIQQAIELLVAQQGQPQQPAGLAESMMV